MGRDVLEPNTELLTSKMGEDAAQQQHVKEKLGVSLLAQHISNGDGVSVTRHSVDKSGAERTWLRGQVCSPHQTAPSPLTSTPPRVRREE